MAGIYQINASKGSYDDADHLDARISVTAKTGKQSVKIDLPSASVSGVFVGQDGKPIANAKLGVLINQTEMDIFKSEADWSRNNPYPTWWAEKSATTDENGRFTFENLDAGKWIIGMPASSMAIAISQPFELKKFDHKQNLVVKSPQIGSAEVALIDKATGKHVEQPFAYALDQFGVSVGPDRSKTALGGG